MQGVETMELKGQEEDLLTQYLQHYDLLIGDQRTQWTFQETVKGIIGAESLVCARIAAFSPWLGRQEQR